MTDLEKKLNKIYNYADLIHSENILILSIIGSLLRESDKPDIENVLKLIFSKERIYKKEYMKMMLRLHNNSSQKFLGINICT